ncbi:MAG: type II toxin-antitoxin system HicA family toxin [Proteobacteria bacterium]|nr:type II toxin-antitoxin system HicA family toxin [Pseudomonadota bacterium]
MPKAGPISYQEFVRKLKLFSFKGPYAGGKHLYMLKGDLRLTIPNPHRQEISVDLLTRILKQAGINKEEWSKKE